MVPSSVSNKQCLPTSPGVFQLQRLPRECKSSCNRHDASSAIFWLLFSKTVNNLHQRMPSKERSGQRQQKQAGQGDKDQGRKNSQARQYRTAKAGKVRHLTELYQCMCSCGLEQVSAPTPEARRCCQNRVGRPGQVASRRAAQWRCRAMSQIRPACTGAWEPGRPPC